jgi:DNA modification methylase
MNVLNQVITDNYALYNGDSADALQGLPDKSVDLAIFSPPFQSLYTYTASERDLGNSKDPAEFWQHFSFISRELLRVMKPGRNVCVHVQQVASTKSGHGVTGLFDFRGDTIRHFVDAGFVFHGEVTIDKDPQAQAIRTKSKALLFVQMERDGAWLRPALADYIVVLRTPGENTVPIKPDLSRNEWIEWARPIWYGIRESETLNVVEARANGDERHICPLQLGTIERCIKLWTNAGETVLSPFAGIGSEIYQAVKLGRKGIGVELKPEYFRVACKNVERASASNELPLFALAGTS